MRAYIKDEEEEEEEEESSERRFERLFSEVTSRKSPEAPSWRGDEHPEADVGKEERVMSRVQGWADNRGAESLERSPPLGVDSQARREKKRKILKIIAREIVHSNNSMTIWLNENNDLKYDVKRKQPH